MTQTQIQTRFQTRARTPAREGLPQSPLAALYRAAAGALLAAGAARHVDLWAGEETFGGAFDTPAVFLEMGRVDWQAHGGGTRSGECRVRLHVLTPATAPTSAAGDGGAEWGPERAGEAFETALRAARALQGAARLAKSAGGAALLGTPAHTATEAGETAFGLRDTIEELTVRLAVPAPTATGPLTAAEITVRQPLNANH